MHHGHMQGGLSKKKQVSGDISGLYSQQQGCSLGKSIGRTQVVQNFLYKSVEGRFPLLSQSVEALTLSASITTCCLLKKKAVRDFCQITLILLNISLVPSPTYHGCLDGCSSLSCRWPWGFPDVNFGSSRFRTLGMTCWMDIHSRRWNIKNTWTKFILWFWPG